MRSPVKQRTKLEGGRLYNDWKQPGRREILTGNLALQANSDRPKSLAFSARIPILDREVLAKRHPEAMNGERRALEKFLNSSEGRPYRTSPKGRSRGKSYGGI